MHASCTHTGHLLSRHCTSRASAWAPNPCLTAQRQNSRALHTAASPAFTPHAEACALLYRRCATATLLTPAIASERVWRLPAHPSRAPQARKALLYAVPYVAATTVGAPHSPTPIYERATRQGGRTTTLSSPRYRLHHPAFYADRRAFRMDGGVSLSRQARRVRRDHTYLWWTATAPPISGTNAYNSFPALLPRRPGASTLFSRGTVAAWASGGGQTNSNVHVVDMHDSTQAPSSNTPCACPPPLF